MSYFSDLEKISGVVKLGERTLQFIPEDYTKKWVSYYLRSPVELYSKGAFFSVVSGRPLAKDTAWQVALPAKPASASPAAVSMGGPVQRDNSLAANGKLSPFSLSQ